MDQGLNLDMLGSDDWSPFLVHDRAYSVHCQVRTPKDLSDNCLVVLLAYRLPFLARDYLEEEQEDILDHLRDIAMLRAVGVNDPDVIRRRLRASHSMGGPVRERSIGTAGSDTVSGQQEEENVYEVSDKRLRRYMTAMPRWQRVVFEGLEFPASSYPAALFSTISGMAIVGSCINVIVQSLPENVGVSNNKVASNPFLQAESVFIPIFLVEMFARFITAPTK